MTRTTLALGIALALAGLGLAAQVRESPAPGEWRTFTGSWSAVGERRTLPTEGGRPSAIVELSGTMLLTGGEGLGRGFRGEVIGYDDGGNLSVGRAVWTDERGDRIFSVLKGEPVEAEALFDLVVRERRLLTIGREPGYEPDEQDDGRRAL